MYDANGSVEEQTLADSGVYEFAYTLDGSGKVTQTDLTDPEGRSSARHSTPTASR